MNLSIGEKIMILRNRKGLSRRKLGEIVYKDNAIKELGYPDGRLKKVETGVIRPNKFYEKELETFARVLEEPIETFYEDQNKKEITEQKDFKTIESLCLDPKFLESYPDLHLYFDLLNTMLSVDQNLCYHTFIQISEYVRNQNLRKGAL